MALQQQRRDRQQRQFDKLWRENVVFRLLMQNANISKNVAEYWYFVGRAQELAYRSDNEQATGSMFRDARYKHEVCRYCQRAIHKGGKHGAFIHAGDGLRTCRNDNGIHHATKTRA